MMQRRSEFCEREQSAHSLEISELPKMQEMGSNVSYVIMEEGGMLIKRWGAE